MDLQPNQIRAALLLSTGMLHKDVATVVKVTPATLCNWQKNDDFIIFLNSIVAQNVEAARLQMTNLSFKSLSVMHELLNSKNDNVRLQACKIVLSGNGLIGDTDGSFKRFGWGIGPKDRGEMARHNATKKLLGSLSI